MLSPLRLQPRPVAAVRPRIVEPAPSDNDQRRHASKEGQLLAERSALQRRELDLERRQATLDAERDAFERERDAHRQEQAEANGATAAEMAADLGRAVDRNMLVNNPSAVAAQIVRAGAIARGEIPAGTPPPPGSMAAAIIRAGQLARGEIVDDRTAPPPGTLAARMIEAAKKAGLA